MTTNTASCAVTDKENGVREYLFQRLNKINQIIITAHADTSWRRWVQES